MLEQDARELRVVSGDFMILLVCVGIYFFDVSVVDLLLIFLLDLVADVRSKLISSLAKFKPIIKTYKELARCRYCRCWFLAHDSPPTYSEC